jgi:hypothetical protein
MTSHRFARVGLTAVAFLTAAAALAGVGCGRSSSPTSSQSQTPATLKKPIEPPTILSPRSGDVMGYDFAVAGTYISSPSS